MFPQTFLARPCPRCVTCPPLSLGFTIQGMGPRWDRPEDSAAHLAHSRHRWAAGAVPHWDSDPQTSPLQQCPAGPGAGQRVAASEAESGPSCGWSRSGWHFPVPCRVPLCHLPDPQLLGEDADSSVPRPHRPRFSDGAGRLHLLQGKDASGPLGNGQSATRGTHRAGEDGSTETGANKMALLLPGATSFILPHPPTTVVVAAENPQRPKTPAPPPFCLSGTSHSSGPPSPNPVCSPWFH